MCGPNFENDDDVITYRASDFFKPDCEVCYASMARVDKGKDAVQRARRTCPKCKRRWLITITWKPDRQCGIKIDRIG